jgi:ribose-phosphate pyrophosphokinase
VSPDFGAVSKCNKFADDLGIPLAIVNKRRTNATEVVVEHFIGNVKGKTAVLVDDVLSTAGSLRGAAETAAEYGAKRVLACVTHAVLTGEAIKNIENSPLEKVFVLDTIEIPPEKNHPKIKVISTAKMLSEAIHRIHDDNSLGTLYDSPDIYDFGSV